MKALLALAALPIALAAAPAHAIIFDPTPETTSTYTFTGSCTDCDVSGSPGTATLVLKDYTPGTDLSWTNFVSFEYHSDKVDFTSYDGFPIFNFISGNIGATAGSYDFSFNDYLFLLPIPLHSFTTHSDGTWDYSENHIGLDYGTHGIWNGTAAVPEPVTWAMMIGGLGVAGGMMRRSRATATTVAYAA